MNENKKIANNDDTIDLLALFQVLLKKWWLIALAAVIGCTAALGFTLLFITPQYQSRATLYVLNNSSSETTTVSDLQVGVAVAADFEVIATSNPVVDAAVDALKKDGYEFTREEIKRMLSISTDTNTRILVINATGEDPTDICLVANAIAEATAVKIGEIMKTNPPSIVEYAEVSVNPSSPNLKKNAVEGFLLGAVLVCGILVVTFLLNDKIKTEDDVEKYLETSTLAVIPYIGEKDRKKEKAKKKKRQKEKSETKNTVKGWES